CASTGIDVVLLDLTRELAETGKCAIQQALENLIRKGKLTLDRLDGVLRRIEPTADYADLAACDLVIEAVAEDRQIKADVTRKVAAVIGDTAIFASNTSTLPITGLAAAWSDPQRFVGLHFFSPVERMALVEVIRGKQTSVQTMAHALDFVAQLRKTP